MSSGSSYLICIFSLIFAMRVAKAAVVKFLQQMLSFRLQRCVESQGVTFCSLKFAVNLVFWVIGVMDYYLYHFDHIFKCW